MVKSVGGGGGGGGGGWEEREKKSTGNVERGTYTSHSKQRARLEPRERDSALERWQPLAKGYLLALGKIKPGQEERRP
jgi:hypothetical protein